MNIETWLLRGVTIVAQRNAKNQIENAQGGPFDICDGGRCSAPALP